MIDLLTTPPWFIYLLESTVCLMFFAVFYLLFMRKQTLFQVNRYYLLVTLFLSLFIPAIDWFINVPNSFVTPVVLLDTVVVTARYAEGVAAQTMQQFPWLAVLLLSGSGLVFLFLIGSLGYILSLRLNSQVVRQEGVVFVINNKINRPFSFGHYIFLHPELFYNDDYSHIITHEKVHVRQYHTFDLLVSGVVAALQWFNPFAWIYRDAFREVHEYMADQQVLKQGVDPILYKKTMVEEAGGLMPGSLSFFNVSFTKRRFKMMSTIKTPKTKALKVLAMVPVTIIMVLVFSCSTDYEDEVVPKTPTEVSDVEAPPAPSKVNDDAPAAPSKVTDDAPVYKVVDQMPEYEGGTQKLLQDIGSGVVFPEKAKANGIEAKVYVQFVIDESGSVTNVSMARITDFLHFF
ncbi:MAG: M56 family metallopeptidase [Salinivirgaceae bacterium]